MDIGETKPARIVEPIEDPFTVKPATEIPAEQPREVEVERELVEARAVRIGR